MKQLLRMAGFTLFAVGLAACSAPAGQIGPAPSASGATPPSGAGGSPASASPTASPSASVEAGSNGQLGMILEVNNSGWQKAINSSAKRGMAIVFVMPNQPAAKAGLSVGDVVTAMNGVAISNSNITNREIRKLKVGDKVGLDVERRGGPAKVDLTVEPATQLDLGKALDDALVKDPNNAVPYFLRATYSAKDAQAALNDLNKAMSLRSDFVSAYVMRGTLLQSSDPDKAMADFDKAISLDGNYQPAYVNRSVLLSQRKQYDKALQDDQKAVDLDSSDPAAYSNLGIGLVNVGKVQDGLTAENKALEIDPLFGPALLYRGLIYRDASKSDLENASRLVKDDRLRAIAADALSKMP